MYTQCKGVTRKGDQCRGGAMPGSNFCGNHNPDHVPGNKCSVTLKNGRQCRGGAIRGTDLCLTHTAHTVGIAKVQSGSGVVDVAYRKYLTSAKWKSKRDRRVEMDNYSCVLCQSNDRLEVHHVTYSRLGFETMWDLRTLCHDCHEMVSEEERTTGRDKANERFISEKLKKRRAKKLLAHS